MNGVYTVSATVGLPPLDRKGSGVLHVRLAVGERTAKHADVRNGDEAKLVEKNVRLQAGTFVKVVCDAADSWGTGPLEIRRLAVRMEKCYSRVNGGMR